MTKAVSSDRTPTSKALPVAKPNEELLGLRAERQRPLSPFLCVIASTCVKVLLIHSYRSTDFEVHRNWLAVTHSLPLSQWYQEQTSEWTLDYPPFFAWFEKMLAFIASYSDPEMLVISNLNYASLATIRFQRASVILTEFVLIASALMFIKNGNASEGWDTKKFAIFALTLSNAGLIIVDHIHFQYNGFLLGILILSLYFIVTGRDLLGGITYAILINFKHIYAYAAPLYFVYLLRHYCFEKLPDSTSRKFSLKKFAILGISVITVFLISFGPFLWHGQLLIVLARLFPVKRGLTHAYWAPNFWAIYNAVDRLLLALLGRRQESAGSLTRGTVGEIEHGVLFQITPAVTLTLSVIAMAPVLLSVWRRPHKETFASALCYVMMTSFIFGWHVHEKAILMVTVPLCLIATRSPAHIETFLFMNLIANYSLIPLLFRPEEALLRVCLVLAHSAFSFMLLGEPLPVIWDYFSWKQGFYCIYVLGLVVIQVVMFIQPLAALKMEFLPLLLTSVYCGVGIIICMQKLFQIYYIDVQNTSIKLD